MLKCNVMIIVLMLNYFLTGAWDDSINCRLLNKDYKIIITDYNGMVNV